MNRSQILLAGIALLGSGLCSCSSEEPVVNTGEVSDKDQSLYLKVALRDVNSATRAADSDEFFEAGTEAENKIQNLQFKFYDASGTQIFQQTVQNIEFKENTWSVGQIGTATIKVDVEKGSNMPAYVVCFANPVNWTGIENTTKMQELRNEKRDGFKGAQGNFAMNNSVFFGTDPISNSQDVKMVGAPIQKGQLFTSKEAAEAADATQGNVVDIYIERYAAKVKVSVADNAVANATVGDYTLKFNPEYVGITADAADMYAVKRFSTTDGDDAPIPSLADVNRDLGTWSTWNDAALHRSYWACSPAYYATDFPSVADNIIDVAPNGTTGAGAIVAPYQLKYYSYNQIKNNAGKDGAKAIAANGADVNLYTLENTMGAAAFASRNPKAAAPSVLLVGNTTLSANGTDLPAGTSFFIWNNNIYFGTTVPTGAAANASTIMNAMLDAQTVLAADAQGTKLTAAALQNSTVEVVHPAKELREVTGTLLSEELVTLQITKVGANEIFYKPTGSDTWTPLTDQALNFVNRQLAGQLNYAHAYTSGKCYYTIPIQHLGYTENTVNPPLTDGKLDWAKVRVGDFGLVRNHVYDINITNINGYGTGILNLDNPIVTPMETNSYWIKYSLNVLNWRIVPTQEVVLP